MRVLAALALALLLAGCTAPFSGQLEAASVTPGAPTILAIDGRLDDAHPMARLAIHVPTDAHGIRFDVRWACPQENLAPEVKLLDMQGHDAARGGHMTSGGAPQSTGGFSGVTSGVWEAAPGDYFLQVGFAFGFPHGDTFDVALHAEPLNG